MFEYRSLDCRVFERLSVFEYRSWNIRRFEYYYTNIRVRFVEYFDSIVTLRISPFDYLSISNFVFRIFQYSNIVTLIFQYSNIVALTLNVSETKIMFKKESCAYGI